MSGRTTPHAAVADADTFAGLAGDTETTFR
jgi:hypothetical protein